MFHVVVSPRGGQEPLRLLQRLHGRVWRRGIAGRRAGAPRQGGVDGEDVRHAGALVGRLDPDPRQL
eukprot:scaffold17703_cov119-Isochrysis_galbana.AAC.3